MGFYGVLVHAGYPLRWWARLEVEGRDLLPSDGPVLVVANHDSMIDPLAVAASCYPIREVRFLAMAELWRSRILRLLLDGAGQIPLERRGGGEHALRHAVKALDRGEAIGIFPEGGLSRGRAMRAHRGVAQLAAERPEVPILLAAVTGGDDVVRFPRRPRLRVRLLVPEAPPASEGLAQMAQRLLNQIRAVAPPAAAGRRDPLASRLRERRQRRVGRP